jgi:glyoxylase-like metal-dependent hydrolase (beta-lactamase superfamily II)
MRQIADGVFEVPFTFVHAYLVVVDDGVVLIDTGLPGRSTKVQRALADMRRVVGDVHTILLTHWHTDHSGGLADLKRGSGARVVAHQADAGIISGTQPPPSARGIVRLSARILGNPERVAVDETLAGDGPTPVPGITAFHTPGHTDGHTSYLLDRLGGVLFVGDAARGGAARLGHSPKAATADVTAARSSVARLAELNFAVAVFGHGRAVRGGAVDKFRALAARSAV